MRNKLFKLFLLVFVVFALMGCKSNEPKPEDKPLEHTHELVLHEAVEATTEKEGNSAYYSCKGCDKYFSDKDGKNEIAKDSWVIAKIVVEDKGTFTIKVIDLDGEVLVNDEVAVDKYANVYELIKNDYEADASLSEYGAWINSIKGSVVDGNWSMMLYVNGESSWDSCDKVTPKKDDVIEFKNECWAAVDYGYGASMDAVDVLLDKVVYSYLKNQMKDTVEGIKDYTGSTYWEMLMIDLVKRSGMDSKVVDYKLTEDLQNQLKAVNLDEVTGANIGKYFSHAYVAGLVKDDFSAKYTTVLEGLTTWSDNYQDYVTPFVVFPAAFLELGDKIPETVLKEDINGSTEYGPTGNLWKALGQSLFSDRSEAFNLSEYLKAYEGTYDWASNVDNATALMVASAFGVDARQTKVSYNGQELDYVNYILTRYYDSNLGFVKIYDADTALQPSTNQIYAALLAYKAYRYTKAPANIFGPLTYKAPAGAE